MGSSAFAGKPVVIELGDTLPPAPCTTATVWTALAEVTEIGDLVLNRSVYDATSHGASIYRDQILGIADPVNIDLKLNYTAPASNYSPEWVKFNVVQAASYWYRIYYPDDYWHRVEAFVGGLTSSTPLDEKIEFSLKLVCTQDILFENSLPAP